MKPARIIALGKTHVPRLLYGRTLIDLFVEVVEVVVRTKVNTQLVLRRKLYGK